MRVDRQSGWRVTNLPIYGRISYLQAIHNFRYEASIFTAEAVSTASTAGFEAHRGKGRLDVLGYSRRNAVVQDYNASPRCLISLGISQPGQ
jgi:hypothetical protein